MATNNKLYNSDGHILISNEEYKYNRDQLLRMYKISYALFNAYYGEDYYLPISTSGAGVYEYLAQELIRDLEKRKRNIFYRLWDKIKRLMKW